MQWQDYCPINLYVYVLLATYVSPRPPPDTSYILLATSAYRPSSSQSCVAFLVAFFFDLSSALATSFHLYVVLHTTSIHLNYVLLDICLYVLGSVYMP